MGKIWEIFPRVKKRIGKRKMASTTLSANDLKSALQEQLHLLNKSCNEYDKGDFLEAKRISVSLRTLLHDSRSKSLLTLLSLKNVCKYLDSAMPFNANNLMPHAGLVMINFTSTSDQDSCTYKPFLSNRPPLPIQYLSFEAWWNAIIINDHHQNKFTRKDIVLNLADKDGGAHIDQTLGQPYADLTRKNSMGITFVKKEKGVTENFNLMHVECASIRQIAYELFASLNSVLQQ